MENKKTDTSRLIISRGRVYGDVPGRKGSRLAHGSTQRHRHQLTGTHGRLR